MNPGKKQLWSLTGLRFFLATWVVVYHLLPHTNTVNISWLSFLPLGLAAILRTGYVAVTVFFLLSGFVLAYNYDLEHRWTLTTIKRFAVARFARIYPAYLFGLILLCPIVVYRILVGVSEGVGPEAASGTLSVSLLQAWIPEWALSWNYPGWSLSDESFFYCCFPVVGIMLWKFRRSTGQAGLITLFWLLSLVGPVLAILLHAQDFGNVTATMLDLHMDEWANVVRYNPLVRLPEFCAGIVLARIYRSFGTEHYLQGRGYWLYVPGLLVSAVTLSYADRIPYPLVHNGLLLPAYACILLGLALGGGSLVNVLSTKPLVFLGNASYAMYILHYPIGVWLLVMLKRVWAYEPEGLWWAITYTSSVILLSSLFFKAVEEPAHNWLRRKLTTLLVPTAAV